MERYPQTRTTFTVTFVRTPMVIKLIRTLWLQAYLVGFKLEVGLSDGELIAKAYTSLQENRADLVVANNQNEIAESKHYAYLINPKKEIESRGETKQEISGKLLDLIESTTYGLRNLCQK